MDSTMQDAPLLIRDIVRHGEWLYGHKKVFTVTPDGVEEENFFQISKRAEQLAAALTKLGVARGDRVATFMWNNQAHLEAYLAVPCMGAVLHTLNIRLFPEQLAYIISHAEDKVIIVDASLVPMLARVRDQIGHVEHFIVHGRDDSGALGETLDYDELVDAAIMCYTSGTTAIPRASSTRTARSGCTRWPPRRSTRWASARRTGACSSSRCSTSTPGARRSRRTWRGAS
jgi:fatty-acyl-CoA synthase